MSIARLKTSPPDGCGLQAQMADKHWEDVTRGREGELIAARVLLKPVDAQIVSLKTGKKRTTTYELVRLELAEDSHDADTLAWEITRSYEARTSGSSQTALPFYASPSDQRLGVIEALGEWTVETNTTETDVDARWVDYFGGREHSASETYRSGSLVQLLEFAKYVGALVDEPAGKTTTDDEPDDDDTDPDDEPIAAQATETVEPGAGKGPEFSG